MVDVTILHDNRLLFHYFFTNLVVKNYASCSWYTRAVWVKVVIWAICYDFTVDFLLKSSTDLESREIGNNGNRNWNLLCVLFMQLSRRQLKRQQLQFSLLRQLQRPMQLPPSRKRQQPMNRRRRWRLQHHVRKIKYHCIRAALPFHDKSTDRWRHKLIQLRAVSNIYRVWAKTFFRWRF